jgi:hypothetical protein
LFDLFDKDFDVIASAERSPIETWSKIMMGFFDEFVVYQQK